MIYSEDCLPGSCPLGISKHEKLLLQLYTVHVHVLAFQENLVALDHWMTLFLGPAINFHPREGVWLLPTVRVNAITFYSVLPMSLPLLCCTNLPVSCRGH